MKMNYFLSNLIAMMLIVFVVIFIAAFVTFKKKNIDIRGFVKSKKGKGAVASAGLGISVIAIISLIIFLIPNNANANPFENGTWFNDAGVYIGLDYTKKRSPMCEANDPTDNRGTSNMGAWGNLWQSKDKSLRVNSRYTHHSCFIGEDAKGYDGLGVQVEWKLWKRK